jgi:hypothetical protein
MTETTHRKKPLRLAPLSRARIVWMRSAEIAARLVLALEATGRYTAGVVPFFQSQAAIATNAPKEVIQILGGGRAIWRNGRH